MSLRKQPSSTPVPHCIVLVRVLITIFALLCFLSIFKLSSQLKLQERTIETSIYAYTVTPKIAFLFLVRRNVLLDFVWDSFFEKADPKTFSIYVHSEPGFVLDKSNTISKYFHGRHLNNSVQVTWGEISMIEAERLLFAAALGDISNQRFVLISDSCVPLYNFTYVYSYLMASSRSFVDSFHDMKDRRYDPRMSPIVSKDKWRKGSQWVALTRKHAELVVNDSTIFAIFKKFCKKWPPNGWLMPRDISKLRKHRNCIPDEHYVQTSLAIGGYEDELERRSVTYTQWGQTSPLKRRRAWHPVTFGYGDVSLKKLTEIKDTKHVYHESEQKTEWCRTNSAFAPCFLFARKFTPAAALQLLSQGVI